MKGVPLAALEIVLRGLIEAGIYEEDNPGCLLAAAAQLGELRTRLASCPLRGLRVEEASAQALACIDVGNFDAAIEALRRGREAIWTAPAETQCEEAELYSKEALIEHLRGRFRDAAGNYGAAAALIIESGNGDAWPHLIGQSRELCDDGRHFGNRESLLLAASICHGALGLVVREQSPDKWAATKHCLGQALFMLGARHNEPDRLGAAIDAYLAALEEWTRDRSPSDWGGRRMISAMHCRR
jgi:tetratricopeptide (TPR) repeat protein